MESRRSRLIIIAYLRGLLKSPYQKYGLRSLARKELVLASIDLEEQADTTWRAVNAIISIYSDRIAHDSFKLFSLLQLDIIDHVNKLNWLQPSRYVIKTDEQRVLEDPETQKLINDFIYMEENGILEKIKLKILAASLNNLQ